MTQTETLQNLLQRHIVSSMRRGEIFFAEDLEHVIPDAMTLRTTLSRLVQEGTVIVRLARGVYCYPRCDSSFRMLLPEPPEIAAALAARWKVRIVPCGAQAAFLAGLTGLDMYSLDYQTDGTRQVFHLQNGRTINFIRRQSVKVFDFRDVGLRNLSEGFRYIGREHLSDRDRGVAADLLREVPEEDYRHDLKLCPLWVREEFTAIRSVALRGDG